MRHPGKMTRRSEKKLVADPFRKQNIFLFTNLEDSGSLMQFACFPHFTDEFAEIHWNRVSLTFELRMTSQKMCFLFLLHDLSRMYPALAQQQPGQGLGSPSPM